MQERNLFHFQQITLKICLRLIVIEFHIIYVEHPTFWLIYGVLGALIKGDDQSRWLHRNIDKVFPKFLWKHLHCFVYLFWLFAEIGHGLDFSLISEMFYFEEINESEQRPCLINKL